ncbi:hypothetical protein V2H45_05935 [Tumidithrix elongata RA019]|uniref:Uncharacterized protein n=1 Tax=Tumidithrix elongata BACA0141 TaxID=2716417 RepID=A0AAW9Q0A1_9CYAN|nr:hypothetical protein [Tumidithrix elongata RA019]
MIKAGAKTRRYEVVGVYYDNDFALTSIVPLRIYKDEIGTVQTPITSLLVGRFVNTDCAIPKAKEFEPRYVNACSENGSSVTGESNFTVIVPFHPTNEVNHKAQIREIAKFPDVLAISYFGETHTTSIERFIR